GPGASWEPPQQPEAPPLRTVFALLIASSFRFLGLDLPGGLAFLGEGRLAFLAFRAAVELGEFARREGDHLLFGQRADRQHYLLRRGVGERAALQHLVDDLLKRCVDLAVGRKILRDAIFIGLAAIEALAGEGELAGAGEADALHDKGR